jgi:hypothetical protein
MGDRVLVLVGRSRCTFLVSGWAIVFFCGWAIVFLVGDWAISFF